MQHYIDFLLYLHYQKYEKDMLNHSSNYFFYFYFFSCE